MEEMKILKMQLAVQMDDIKDAEMLLEYAEEAKKCGEEAVSQKFIARAKNRMQLYENCSSETDAQLARIRSVNPDIDTDELMHHVYKEYFAEYHDRIKSKLMQM